MQVYTYSHALEVLKIARELPSSLPKGVPEKVKLIAEDYLCHNPFYRWTPQDRQDFVLDIRKAANC